MFYILFYNLHGGRGLAGAIRPWWSCTLRYSRLDWVSRQWHHYFTIVHLHLVIVVPVVMHLFEPYLFLLLHIVILDLSVGVIGEHQPCRSQHNDRPGRVGSDNEGLLPEHSLLHLWLGRSLGERKVLAPAATPDSDSQNTQILGHSTWCNSLPDHPMIEYHLNIFQPIRMSCKWHW